MAQMLSIRKGSEVEVFIEDNKKFKGSYYKAILEETPTISGHKNLKVRYLKLFKEDGSGPYREIVDQSFIRPIPPDDLNDGIVFEEGSVVEADLKSGWWTGVVVKIMEDDKYLVYFDYKPDIIYVEKKKLRLHLDWIDSKWVRVDKKELIKSVFSSGTMVEIKVQFAWLPAIVVKELEDKKKCIVKYWNKSLSFIGESKITTVDSVKVRPKQPSFSVEKYELLDRVEVFSGSTWRQGVVRGIVFEGRYMVSFGESKEASQSNHSDLRPSMDWRNGIWQKRPMPNSRKDTPADNKRNKPGNEMTDDVVNEKESGSLIAMETHRNKIPEPMKNHNGLGNESTREKTPEEHTQNRKRGELEHNSDINETSLSLVGTSNVVKNVAAIVAANVEETQSKALVVVLPFAKKSPFWKTYESMEVFKRVPQSPHFNPLGETKEDFREGYAIGMMVTYSGLWERLKDLETDVPVSQLDSLKDSFAELEKHGFNVTLPLSRIEKLLALKDRQLNLLEELKALDKEMMEESSKPKAEEELSEMKQKILEVKQQILELKEQEVALEKRKEAVKEQKDAAYKKICQMESCARDLGVKLKDVKLEFETTLSAPW